jgi:hypothetical protein
VVMRIIYVGSLRTSGILYLLAFPAKSAPTQDENG